MALPPLIDAVEFRREAYRLTKSEWSKVIGIIPSHYSEFTTGRRGLSPAQMARCFEFGVPAECLFQCQPTKGMWHISRLLRGIDTRITKGEKP